MLGARKPPSVELLLLDASELLHFPSLPLLTIPDQHSTPPCLKERTNPPTPCGSSASRSLCSTVSIPAATTIAVMLLFNRYVTTQITNIFCLIVSVGESGDRLTRAAKVLEQLSGTNKLDFNRIVDAQIMANNLLKVKLPFTPRPATPSEPSVSEGTRRSLSMSPSVAPRPRKFSSVASRSRSTSSGRGTSPRPETSGWSTVYKNICDIRK